MHKLVLLILPIGICRCVQKRKILVWPVFDVPDVKISFDVPDLTHSDILRIFA